MTDAAFERPIEELSLALGESVPDHLAIPGDRPGQIGVLEASGMFGEVALANLTDAQVEFSALVVTTLPLVAVAVADVPDGDHVDAGLVLNIEFGPRSSLTVVALPCGVGSVEGMRLA
jgi:hypothetical protein